ncbi:unnamed protein product, partial [Effrenium voratum]
RRALRSALLWCRRQRSKSVWRRRREQRRRPLRRQRRRRRRPLRRRQRGRCGCRRPVWRIWQQQRRQPFRRRSCASLIRWQSFRRQRRRSGSSSGGSLFGGGAAPASSGGSLFGASGGGSGGSIFGGASSGGLFGGSAGASSGAAFGSGGAAGFAASASGAELAQARATVVEHRKVSDLMQMWEERIHKQAQHFDAFAEQVLRFDCDLIANAAKVKVLREEHGQLKGRQELVDRSLQQIWDQQDSLGRLLSGMLEALRPQQQQQADEAAGNAAAPARSHQRALQLTLQLDELERQAEDLARETGKVQSNLYKEPLTTVVRVLDAHAGALDAISTQVTSVNQRLQDIERTM